MRADLLSPYHPAMTVRCRAHRQHTFIKWNTSCHLRLTTGWRAWWCGVTLLRPLCGRSRGGEGPSALRAVHAAGRAASLPRPGGDPPCDPALCMPCNSGSGVSYVVALVGGEHLVCAHSTHLRCEVRQCTRVCQERAVCCGFQLIRYWVKRSASCICLLQVPDVSGMIHTSDFPCLRVSEDVPDTDKRNPDIKVRTSRHCARHRHACAPVPSAANSGAAISQAAYDCALRQSGAVLQPSAATSSVLLPPWLLVCLLQIWWHVCHSEGKTGLKLGLMPQLPVIEQAAALTTPFTERNMHWHLDLTCQSATDCRCRHTTMTAAPSQYSGTTAGRASLTWCCRITAGTGMSTASLQVSCRHCPGTDSYSYDDCVIKAPSPPTLSRCQLCDIRHA